MEGVRIAVEVESRTPVAPFEVAQERDQPSLEGAPRVHLFAEDGDRVVGGEVQVELQHRAPKLDA